VVHLDFHLGRSGFRFVPGDSIGIVCPNDETAVRSVLERIRLPQGFTPDTPFRTLARRTSSAPEKAGAGAAAGAAGAAAKTKVKRAAKMSCGFLNRAPGVCTAKLALTHYVDLVRNTSRNRVAPTLKKREREREYCEW
jgi:sulfite reductase alpha subunit-like flavoprotein